MRMLVSRPIPRKCKYVVLCVCANRVAHIDFYKGQTILVTTGVFWIRKGKRFPWRFSTLFPQFFLNFSTRSEAECGNFEEILWKLSGKSEWKSFPLEYPENGSWLQIYLLSSIFGVSPPPH